MILKSVTCLFLLPALVASIRVSCLFLKVGFRKCGAKIHGDSGPEKPNPPDLHQYRPETSLATGGIWERETLWGLGYGFSRDKVPRIMGA